MMEEFLSSHIRFAPSQEKAWAEDITYAQMETIEHLLAGNIIDESQLASIGVEKTVVELPKNGRINLKGSKNAELIQKIIEDLDPNNPANKEIILLQRNAGFQPIGLNSSESTPRSTQTDETSPGSPNFYYDSEEESIN
jgi:hypothetical protein